MLVDEVPEILKMSADDIELTPELIQTEISSDYITGVGKLGERLIIILDLEKVLATQQLADVAEVASQIDVPPSSASSSRTRLLVWRQQRELA